MPAKMRRLPTSSRTGSPQTPAVTNTTPQQQALLNTGSAEAARRLQNPTCAAFFGGTENGLQALNSLTFSIDPSLPEDGHPQGVLEGDTVRVNPHGSSFVTPDDSSYTFYLLDTPVQAGRQTIILTGDDARAFAQLHEAGHKGERYGATDKDGFVPATFLNNYINNWKIWKSCFSEAKPKKTNTLPMPGLQ